jgi:aspartyl/asparaginyl beta-hydroxylase (cupin superfamily)
MDLSFLRQEVVFGLNKIYLGLPKFGFYPRYMVVVNDKVIEQSADVLRDMTAIKFVPDRKKHFLPKDAFTYHIKSKGLEKPFYRDISLGVEEGHTVTYAALQIAYYMGFDEVVIIGLDHRYQYQGAPNETLKLIGPDPNHFSQDYFRDQVWDAPNLAEAERYFAIAKEVYETDGRRILDATPCGVCDVFPKEDYRAVFALS